MRLRALFKNTVHTTLATVLHACRDLVATTIATNNGFYAFAFSGICFGTPMIIVRQMNVFMEKKPDVVELTKEQQQ